MTDSRERVALRAIIRVVDSPSRERPQTAIWQDVLRDARAILAEPPDVFEPSSGLEGAAARVVRALSPVREVLSVPAVWSGHPLVGFMGARVSAIDTLDAELRAPRDMGPPAKDGIESRLLNYPEDFDSDE